MVKLVSFHVVSVYHLSKLRSHHQLNMDSEKAVLSFVIQIELAELSFTFCITEKMCM